MHTIVQATREIWLSHLYYTHDLSMLVCVCMCMCSCVCVCVCVCACVCACVLLYHQVTGTCWCNGHAQTCLPDGKCNCTRNTVSATCQACAAGFYRSNISGGFTCRRKPQCCGVYFLGDALLLTVVEEPFSYSLCHFPTLCVLLDTFCLRITIWMYGILLHIAAILCFTSCCFSPCISTNSFLCMCVSVCVCVFVIVVFSLQPASATPLLVQRNQVVHQ